MKKYVNLTDRQKELFKKIEGYFISEKRATIKDFRAVLKALTNKYTKRENERRRRNIKYL